MRPLNLRLLARASLLTGLAVSALTFGACIAGTPGSKIHRETDQGVGGEAAIDVDASVPDPKDDAPNADPHAVLGADPPHGPFLGGQRVLVHGKGFGADVRLWFGDTEVDPATTVPVDETRAQVTAPPGVAGPTAISTQNGDDASTRRTLEGAYVYDQIYAVPDSGPVSGGTVIEVVGQGTQWDASTIVKIDQKPCATQTLDSATSIACTVPQGTPGSKTITVTTGSEVLSVLDGYTYEDSDNGFKGGLSGSPLAGQLKVLAYNNYTGDAIGGAHAIAGTDIATAIVQDTDASGVTILADASLTGKVTVTVAARCHSPITFVDVPVDTVTVYLDPVLSPACMASGDPPLVGGKPQHTGTIYGELVWDGGVEFKKAPWTNIPAPIGVDEKQVAYVFLASADPTAAFQLPAATSAITPDTPGDHGYEYAIVAPAGNRALYALAGIENRVAYPPTFTAYAMGVVRGVPVLPTDETHNVYIKMVATLDQGLTMTVNAPVPGPKGPDRLRASVALMLGNDGFAVLPVGLKTPFLPVQGDLQFIGVPALTGDLFGSNYISTARAVTGPIFQAPLSVVGRLLSTTTSQPVVVDGFVGVPTLTAPKLNSAWDATNLATDFPALGPPIDITVYEVLSGNGLVHWTIAVPGGDNAVQVPHLDGFELASVPTGPITIGVYGGRIDDFDYANLRYRDLRSTGMSAYALDYFASHL